MALARSPLAAGCEAKGYRETDSEFVSKLVFKSSGSDSATGQPSETLTPVFGHVAWISVDPAKGTGEGNDDTAANDSEVTERLRQQKVYVFGGMMRQDFVRPQPPTEAVPSTAQQRPGSRSDNANRFSSPLVVPRKEKGKLESLEEPPGSPHGTLRVTNLLQTVALHSGQVTKLNPVITPQARYRHSCAIHPTNGYAYIFGGCGSTGYLNDLWYFSHRGESWHEVIAVGEKPSPCCSHQSCFDSSGQHLYVVGGWDAHSDLMHPIHQLVLGGSTWRRIENSQITPRRGFSLFPVIPTENGKMKDLAQGSKSSSIQDTTATDLYWVGHGPLVDSPNQLLKLLPHEHRGAAAVFRRKDTNAPTANAWLLRRRVRELQDRLAEIQRSHATGVPVSKINPLSTLPEDQEEVAELLHAAQELFQETEDSNAGGGAGRRLTPLLASESYILLGYGTSILEIGGVLTSRISEKQKQELPPVPLLLYDAQDPTSTLVVSNRVQLTTLQEGVEGDQNDDEPQNDNPERSPLRRGHSAKNLRLRDEPTSVAEMCFDLLSTEVLGLEGSSAVSLQDGLSLVVGGRSLADGSINASIFIVDTVGLFSFVRGELIPRTRISSPPVSPNALLFAPAAKSKCIDVINQILPVSTETVSSLAGALADHKAQFHQRCDVVFGSRNQGQPKSMLQPRYPEQGRFPGHTPALARRPIVRSSLRGKDQFVHELFEKSSSTALANSIARRKERVRQLEEREKELALLGAPRQVTFEEGLREYEKATEHIGIHERYRALVDQLRPYGLHRAAIVTDELLHAETQAHTEGMGLAHVRKVKPAVTTGPTISLSEAHKWYRAPKITLAVKEATNGRLERQTEVDYAGESATSAIRRVQEENQRSLLASATLDCGKDSSFLRELMTLTKPEHSDSTIAFIGHPTDSATRFREVLDRRTHKTTTLNQRPWSGGTLRVGNNKPQSLLSARAIMNVAAGRCAASEKQFLSKEREVRKEQKK